MFLLTLAPSVSSADTLAKAKRFTHFYSVALLLEKRFACFPCAWTAFISYAFLFRQKSFTASRKRNSPLPSFLSGRQIRNDNRRKEYNMTLSEESGIGYRKTHLTPTFFAQILHSTPYFFILLFPTAFYDRSRMTGRYLVPSCKNRLLFLLTLAPSDGFAATFPVSGDGFFMSHFQIFRFYSYYFLFFCVCPHLPLSSAPLTLSPTSGDSLGSLFFLYSPSCKNSFSVWVISVFFYFTHIKTMNSFFLNVSFPRTRREVPSLARR